MGKNQHVMYNNNEWVVKDEGENRPSGSYRTQREAIEAGRQRSMREQSELIVHRKDNNAIRMKSSYGNDPETTKG